MDAEQVAERPSPISLRLVAAIVDFTIVMVLVVLAVAVGESFGAESAGNAAGLALVAAYPIVAIGISGRTVGKRLCNLEVRSVAGSAPGWGRAVVRFVVTAAPFVVSTSIGRSDAPGWIADAVQVVLATAVYGPILIDATRRGLHDRVAGTRVVCTAPPLAGIVEQLVARDAERPPDD